jgi:hypothetical protein
MYTVHDLISSFVVGSCFTCMAALIINKYFDYVKWFLMLIIINIIIIMV